MALLDLAAALRTAFKARGCPATIWVGEQYLRDHADENRVIIIPQQDTFGPKDPSVLPLSSSTLNPRPLATRTVNADAVLWAMAEPTRDGSNQLEADQRILDALVNCFVACLMGAAYGVQTLGAGSYVNDQATHVRRGLGYRLSFSFAMPILDIKWPPAAPDTYTMARGMGADIAVQELLGDPPTYQTGVEFEIPPVPPS